MTKRRSFIRNSLLTGLSASILPLTASAENTTLSKKQHGHWVWINPDHKDDEAAINELYKKYHTAGIRGIFFEADSEKHFRIAKKNKIQAHRWMWIMNRGEKSLLQSHPELYAINRKGESCADKPPYVNYYRWLCPSKKETLEYLETEVKNTLSKDYVDGIHLDYIRFCDVILPVNLWDTYKLDQTKELPEFDYCYCEVCRSKFKEWKGVDPLDIQFPEASLSWRLFRYNAITNVVNRLAQVAKGFRKPVTAAVFPTPEVAKRNVRQDWVNWNLSAIYPMIYHGFYKEPVSWIGDAVKEGVNALHGRFPLYAGLYIPDFNNIEEIRQGVNIALKNGAAGVSMFGKLTDEILQVLKESGNSTV